MQQEQPQRKGGCFSTLLKILAVLIVIVIILVGIGILYEQQAEKAFLENNPAPGQLVDVGGRNLHIYCIGEGSPTIILDAGQGGWSIDYVDIQTELATTNRVCAYDRAGYGWSDAANDNRTLADISNDLHTLLTNAEIEQPYVLVAFSFSGLSTRYYYEQYSDEIAGSVLLDPAHESHRDLLPQDLASAQQSLLGVYGTFEQAATIGLVRLLNPAEIAPYAPFIATNPASPELYYAGVANPDWWATSRKEFYTSLYAELPALPTTFAIPVRLIGLSDSIADETYAELNEAQLQILRDMAENSENIELTILDDINHQELLNQVETITTVIREMLASL